jgi:hypothetical protein
MLIDENVKEHFLRISSHGDFIILEREHGKKKE